tara:strand:+ start:192 stop:389 length:198 start_codon:yes stop_codon:yes gene_type:complete
MKVGDLVVDTKQNYARGVIIEEFDSSIFEGSDDIYKVYFQKESKAYYTISSNLKILEEIREVPNE